MTLYYVNRNAQPNGDHEVHASTCEKLPENKKYLGTFENCKDAVKEAKKEYHSADGCRICSYACHTR
jgi:hypothetical protein